MHLVAPIPKECPLLHQHQSLYCTVQLYNKSSKFYICSGNLNNVVRIHTEGTPLCAAFISPL